VACHHSGKVIVTATLSVELTRRIGTGPAAFAADCRQAHADDHLDGIGSRPWDARRRLHGISPQTKQPLVHPVFFGSATTGTGVDALMAGIAELLLAA
jgi:ribosomal protection tetracycline resistance protein